MFAAAALLCLASAAVGQSDLFPGPAYLESEGGPESVAAADMTGDNVLDLVASAVETGQIVIHQGRGDGTFLAARKFPVGGRPIQITIADLDRDGRMDVLWLDQISGSLGYGYGTEQVQLPFNPLGALPEEDEASSIEIIDLGLDLWPDVVVSLIGADLIAIHRNVNGQLQPAQVYPAGDGPSLVRGAFWPGDDDPHLFVVQSGVLSRDIGAYTGAAPQLSQTLSIDTPKFAEVVDWNADSWPDLLALDAGMGEAYVYLGQSDGSLAQERSWAVAENSGGMTFFQASGGKRRVLVAETLNHRVGLYEGSEAGDLKLLQGYYLGQELQGIRTADLNRDGVDEVIAPVQALNRIAVVQQHENGLLAYSAIRTGPLPQAIDWVEAGPGTPGRLGVVCLTEPRLRVYDLQNSTLVESTTLTTGETVDRISWAQIDDDGRPDLVSLRSRVGVDVYLSSGDGFLPAIRFPLTNNVVSMGIGDVNADGELDIALADRTVSDVRILHGDGSGSFTEVDAIPTAVPPTVVALHDLDLDGKADLCMLDGSSFVYLFFSLGTGFTPPTRPASGSNPRDVAFGNFNGDAYPDIAVVNGGGDGSFTVFVSIFPRVYNASTSSEPVPGGAQRIALLDANDDGNLDVGIVASGSGEASIHIGNGAGQFAPPFTLPCSALPLDIATTDLDGDGRDDLIVIDSLGETINLLYQGLPPALSIGGEDDPPRAASQEPRPLSQGGSVLGMALPYPNPSRDSVEIRFRAREGVTPQLRIVDARGRLIRRLHPVAEADGWYTARWQGVDERGHRVAGGRYHVDLRAGTRRVSAPIIRLRP